MVLYKYRGNSLYTDAIFSNRAVWFATPGELNDPFECEIGPLNPNWVRRQVDELKHAQMLGFIMQANRCVGSRSNFFKYRPKQTERILAEIKRNKSNFKRQYQIFREIMRDAVGNYPSDPNKQFLDTQNLLAHVGVFSLSEVYNNTLMWSHYAESHQGVCLGFDINTEETPNCFKVIYSREIPAFNENKGFLAKTTYRTDDRGKLRVESQFSMNDPTIRAVVTHKNPEWAYEREWRIYMESGGEYSYPGTMREIIFGLRCNDAIRNHYCNLVSSNGLTGVEFFEIQRVDGTGQLVRSKLVSL